MIRHWIQIFSIPVKKKAILIDVMFAKLYE